MKYFLFPIVPRWQWGILFTWLIVSTVYITFFPPYIGTIVFPQEEILSFDTSKNPLIIFDTQKIQETKTSYTDIYTALSSLDTVSGIKTITNNDFSIALQVKGYAFPEQLSSLSIGEKIFLRDIATITHEPIIQKNQWFDPILKKWKPGTVLPYYSFSFSPKITQWIHSEEKEYFWIDSSVPWIHWTQILTIWILIFIFAPIVFSKIFSPKHITANLPEGFTVLSDISIRPAHVFHHPSLMEKIIEYFKNIQLASWWKYVQKGIIIVLIVFIYWSIPNSSSVLQIDIRAEETSRSERVFDMVTSLTPQLSLQGPLWYVQNTPEHGTLFLASSNTQNIDTILSGYQGRTTDIRRKDFLSGYITTSHVPETKTFIKTLGEHLPISQFFWVKTTHPIVQIVPNFSAIQEKNIDITEVTSFFQLLGKNIFTSFSTELSPVQGTSLSDISLYNKEKKEILLSEITIKTNQESESIPQKIVFSGLSLSQLFWMLTNISWKSLHFDML